MLLYTLSWFIIGKKIKAEIPGSCVSEDVTLSQLDDIALDELICALSTFSGHRADAVRRYKRPSYQCIGGKCCCFPTA